MLNFDFKRPSRKCSVQDRNLEPGEKFYSALLELPDGQLERVDCCIEAWNDPPENCIAWWTSTIPNLEKGRVYWAPTDVLLAYFEHLLEKQIELDTTYITALVLIQKKILKLVETLDDSTPPVMILKHSRSKNSYEVTIVDVPPARINEIQNELADRLFTDQAPNENTNDVEMNDG